MNWLILLFSAKDWMFVSPKIHILKPNSNVRVFRAGDLGKWLYPWGPSPSLMGLVFL